MTNIVASIEDIKKEIKIDSQGRGYASIRGTARLAGVDESTLREHFSSAGFSTSNLCKTLINHGFDPAGVF